MTRFDAAEPADRRKLFVDAIVAHRERASDYVTIEIDAASLAESDGVDPDLGIPWLQFGDGVVNLDCTTGELETLKSLLDDFPAFKIDDLTRPEDAEGVNVRVSAKADPNRIAQFLDAVVVTVFGLEDDVRVWVAAI